MARLPVVDASDSWGATEVGYYSDVFEELVAKVRSNPARLGELMPRITKCSEKLQEECAGLSPQPSTAVAMAITLVAEVRARHYLLAKGRPGGATLTVRLLMSTHADFQLLFDQISATAGKFAAWCALPNTEVDDAKKAKIMVDLQSKMAGVDATVAGFDPEVAGLLSQCALPGGALPEGEGNGRPPPIAADDVVAFLHAFALATRQIMRVGGESSSATITLPSAAAVNSSRAKLVEPASRPVAGDAASTPTNNEGAAAPPKTTSDSKPQASAAAKDSVRAPPSKHHAESDPEGEDDDAPDGGPHSSDDDDDDQPLDRLTYVTGMSQSEAERQLTRFYARHNPARVPDAAAILSSFLAKGKDVEALMRDLNRKYGVDSISGSGARPVDGASRGRGGKTVTAQAEPETQPPPEATPTDGDGCVVQ